MKLESSIPSNGVKLIDLYNKIISGSLITGPDYQRKLVWKTQHKFSFIETILLNFPFPEIYIASAEIDLSELKAKEVVVDGQQRLTTIVDYIQGRNDFENQTKIKPFDDLTPDEKREFLNYSITVKDLKNIGEKNIIEVFQRINSTNYSLNSNEILNAQFGGGEFAIFCKLLADKTYNPTANETAIDIEKEQRNLINAFFEKNNVFSDNDIKRMFDSQYLMLISSTILEGSYFGRSTKINHYLEKYNDEFTIYNTVLDKLHKSISTIDKLNFSTNSYWFNKANLFTLIIELQKIDIKEINHEILESKLLELEKKVDIYFLDDDISLITDEERKYFENARQGSHELAAREHRGKVIQGILKDSLSVKELKQIVDIRAANLAHLSKLKIPYSILIPTETGLNKGIMDAVSGVRNFLKVTEIHKYDEQDLGPDHKKILNGKFIFDDNQKETNISLYRANGRGDYRIWFSDLSSFADAYNELALISKDGILNILNISKYDYTEKLNVDE